MKNRELYKYELSDYGPLESLVTEFQEGKMELPDAIKQSVSLIRSYTHRVYEKNVGSVEEEFPSLIQSTGDDDNIVDVTTPFPPILRNNTTDKKILKTEMGYSTLNNFSLFLALTDRIFKVHGEFFMEPHTTKVIWGMHKIVYIFTHASNKISLYYDIELKERLTDESTGGKALPTTTLITPNRIFIPIIEELATFFDIKSGSKEFFVRYDLITDMGNG